MVKHWSGRERRGWGLGGCCREGLGDGEGEGGEEGGGGGGGVHFV